jgi:exopolysaccharide production protein ExoQ
MTFRAWIGSWAGVFTHKNYLGNFMAFGSTVFFMDFLIHPDYRPLNKVLLAVFFLLSIVLVIYSKSAAGILIVFLLLGTCLVLFIWSKLRKHLRSLHYIILSIIALIVIVAVLLNLDFFFGLVNRNASLTGRVPLWLYLYNQVILIHPYLGYGYGAIWSFPEFRELTGVAVGWEIPIFIADNGLIDIFLHLGITGVVSILIVIIMSFKNAIMMILNRKDFIYIFPIIALIYVLLANISLSMLLESEYFVWFMIIFPLFIDSFQNPINLVK